MLNRCFGNRHRVLVCALVGLAVAGCTSQSTRPQRSEPVAGEPYEEDAILHEAETFFGKGAQGLADVLNRAFRDNGPPDGYIKGEEGAGSMGVGLRYGQGTVYLKNGQSAKVYWRGPSIGIDVGGSATKTFVLVYRLPTLDALYQRFGGVEGSLYFVGGIGMNYNRNDETILAPVRFGVGWRQGVNLGYLHLSPERSWIPF
jgi:hypothetical protein